MKSFPESDLKWMRLALALARRGEGLTRPNPPVGAVVVKNGRRIGQGWHKKAGGPHAEVFALRAFLRTSNQETAPADDGFLSALLFGALGTIAALVALNAAWARRLTGVRKPLTARKGEPA